jgi:hypothetical protein
MRIESTRKQTPQGSAPGSAGDQLATEKERFVWEVLAPRLLQPSKLAFIQALLRHGQPLTVGALAKAAGISESHAGYQCRSMQRAGVLEMVGTAAHADGEGGGETFYFFPELSEEPGLSPSPKIPKRPRAK